MSKGIVEDKRINAYIDRFECAIESPVKGDSPAYYTGVDLGTACVALAVLDADREPVAGAYTWADVVRDGMVVDYINAIDIVSRMKRELEEKLGAELVFASAALPPGTDELDGGVIKNVVMGAGFTLTSLSDEPTAANALLGIRDGAVVDIGGGTTGISILKDGCVIYVADEPTGGTHFSLVLAGAYKMTFDEAERYKRNPENHGELLPILRPVVEKVSSIIRTHIDGHDVDEIALVGGTCCLTGIEAIIEQEVGIPCSKPKNPLFVTPLGIALTCKDEDMLYEGHRLGD
ncbi:MAG: ethanolamine utilization protein EutJ [Clostridiales Family XIII bacterium]|jgi:ethanolamine utilization protein EutJ|nr:ethanolamine utilization protein EutJ [Clostridiales Family XIII bacterium]